MWHEARKQEKMIRGMMVDYRRRAERRKDYYEKIKAEPAQFIQLHGRPCKIHLDPAIAAAGDSPAIMMPWQGDTNNLIDRFDVRAHLDYIPEVQVPEVPSSQLSQEERHANYERYRILAQNTFLAIGEDKFLSQLAIEEQFGVTLEEKEAQREKLNEKKSGGVSIGYNYSNPDANTVPPSTSAGTETSKQQEESEDDSDLEIIDVDLSIDVNKVEPAQAHELNAVGPLYGLAGCDLFSFLTGDADDAELQKQRAREEKEKAMFSGRKSRRERRAHRDKKLATRVLSPPSYAAPDPHARRQLSRSASRSRSRSASPAPLGAGVTFITSFGGEDDDTLNGGALAAKAKPLYADKVKQNLAKMDNSYSAAVRGTLGRSPVAQSSQSSRSPVRMGPHRPGSRSPSRSRSKSYRSKSTSRSRSLSRAKSYRSRSRSYRSRSRSYRSRSRSYRSRSRSYRSKSRSLSRSRSRYRSRSRSYSARYRPTRSRSRSRSYSRRKRSQSRSSNHSIDYARRNSRSMSVDSPRAAPAAVPAVPRYYGRRKSDAKSSSDVSLESGSSDDNDDVKNAVGVKPNSGQNQLRLSGSSSKASARQAGASLKDKMKRKMAALLARQLRADKKAAAERRERESQLQAQRDDEMRELVLKMRRRNREQRHQNDQHSSDTDSERSHASSARKSPESTDAREKRSPSRSPSPEAPKKIPVWQSHIEAASTSSEQRARQRPYEGPDYRYDRRERDYPQSEDRREKNYPSNEDRNYEQSYKQEDYTQEYYNKGDRYDTHRPYANRRPYGRGHYSRRDNDYCEVEYDDQWERETSGYRGGSGRRPYGGYRGGHRGDHRGGFRRSHGQNESHEGPEQGYGRGYDDYQSYESRQDSRRTDGPSKTRKLVDY